jgi:hypothetical protein
MREVRDSSTLIAELVGHMNDVRAAVLVLGEEVERQLLTS